MLLTLKDISGNSQTLDGDVGYITGAWRLCLEHRIALKEEEGKGSELSSSAHNVILVDDVDKTLDEFKQTYLAS